jgi:hypothetical protein
MGGMVRAKPPKRIPTVLSVNEVHCLMACFDGVYSLMCCRQQWMIGGEVICRLNDDLLTPTQLFASNLSRK